MDYASTEGAIATFTRALAKQVAQRGVRVNAVAGQGTPLGRPGQPVEIAPVYLLLASAEATDVTGQVYGAS